MASFKGELPVFEGRKKKEKHNTKKRENRTEKDC